MQTTDKLTAEEIQCLKDLAEGWEKVWSNICNELVGWDGKGRLHSAIQGKVSPQDKGDAVSFIVERFDNKLRDRKLLAEFDPAKGNVFQWLCNSQNLYWYIREFRHQMQKNKIGVSLDEKNDTQNSDGETLEDTLADKSRFVNKTVNIRLKELVTKITDSPLVLNNQKNDTIPQHACLQLYPRIDKENAKMQELIGLVHETVRKANVQYIDPPETISGEHDIADERFENDIAELVNEIDEARQQRLHSSKPILELEEQLFAAEFERLFVPLIIEQVKLLEGVNENTASAHRSRYRKELPNLLPPEFKTEWENLQNNELSD
jgi:hypothetical protein